MQAEDELSAMGMVIGANWNGARAFTATSGPGVSLMSEFLGLAYFAEVPAVLIDVQRAGPSTGCRRALSSQIFWPLPMRPMGTRSTCCFSLRPPRSASA